MTDAAVTTGVAPTGRAWIARPWVDLVIGCGGWSLPLLLVAYATPVATSAGWSSAFYSLALVANYPHYMATIYRAYGRADFRAHRLWTVYGTAVLVALAAAAHVRLALLPWLFTAYVMWSPWHYTGQNFGLLMMFLRRGGQAVTPGERRWLRGAFIASYVMLLVTFNRGTSSDPLVLSLGLGPAVASLATAVAASAFVIGAGWGLFMLWRRGPRRALLAPAILVTTQALWFVVPTALSWAAGIGVPQTRYSSGILAVMHAFQYLSDHAALRSPRAGRRLVGGPLLARHRRRRHGAVRADSVAGQLRRACRLHGQHADRRLGGEPAALHARRRRVEASRQAREPGADRERAVRARGPGHVRRPAPGRYGSSPPPRSPSSSRSSAWTSGATVWPRASPMPRRSKRRCA